MNNLSNAMVNTVPAAGELRKVKGFNPLRCLRQTTSAATGETVWRLDLKYQRMWFKIACPHGRMLLNPLHITDQLAIYEAMVFSGKSDTEPIARVTATSSRSEVPDGKYIESAQDAALSEALNNAGFGIQLCDFADNTRPSLYGSEIPVSQIPQGQQPASAPTAGTAEQTAVVPAATPQQSAETMQKSEEKPLPFTMRGDPQSDSPIAPAVAVPEAVQATPEGNSASAAVQTVKSGEESIPTAQPAASEDTIQPQTSNLPAEATAGSVADTVAPAAKGTPAQAEETSASQATVEQVNVSPAPEVESESAPRSNDENAAPATHDAASDLEQLRQNTQQRVIDFPSSGAADQLSMNQQQDSASVTPADPLPKNTSYLPSGKFTAAMSLDDLSAKMTLEDALAVVVNSGVCKGWTLAQVFERRAPSLKWYVSCTTTDNLLRAASKMILDSPDMKKAG